MYFGFRIIAAALVIFIALFTNINPQCYEDGDENIPIIQIINAEDMVSDTDADVCCSFPCQHGGICLSNGEKYECDCKNTGYYGKNCQKACLGTMLSNIFVPSRSTEQYLVTHCSILWFFVNNIKALHRKVAKLIYLMHNDAVKTPSTYKSGDHFITMDSYYNISYYSQELPSVPNGCPTPMGTKGPTNLPPASDVAQQLLERDEFKPCPYGTNLMFVAYAQHFTHQFFKSDQKNVGITEGTHGVETAQIYGFSMEERNALRSKHDGKLKVSVVKEEEFPPYLEDVPEIHMFYPDGYTIEEKIKNCMNETLSNVSPKFGLAHPLFASTPFIFAISTIWIREHNRICDLLKKEHPSWNDERLYQTARLIITAEMIKITVEQYVQHLSQYKIKLIYEPSLTHKTRLQYQNTIRIEFNLLYHWHAMIPDAFKLKGRRESLIDNMFTGNEIALNNFDELIGAMMRTPCGQVTAKNYPKWLLPISTTGIEWARKLRLQSLNNYRRYFGLPPYRKFSDITDDPQIIAALENLYQDIEAVELFPALLIEKNRESVVGPSTVVMGGSWAVKGLMASPVGSPGWWKPSTFGGQVGWNVIQNASLYNLICNNLKNKCANMHVGFAVPQKCITEIRNRIREKYNNPS